MELRPVAIAAAHDRGKRIAMGGAGDGVLANRRGEAVHEVRLRIVAQAGEPGRALPLPTPVSISTVVAGVRTIQVWMRAPRSPTASSQKSGLSQAWWRAIASGVESGSIEAVG